MFDHKQAESTDNDILSEIIKMCETYMGGGLKKPDEAVMPDPMEGSPEEESAESPMDEQSEIGKPDLEGADLEELMKMYESIKG